MFHGLKRAYCVVHNITSAFPPGYPTKMSETYAFKRARYDGRSKKRQWEERRSDKGAGLNIDKPEKKIKTTEETGTGESTGQIVDKVKRRKYVLLLGYSGTGYYGMQRNPLLKTIEEDVIKALHVSGFIDDSSYKTVQNMQFQRAARTDKGVSAARQIISLKMKETFDKDTVNKHLPDVIRIFGCKRVTKGFNSKSQCDSRTYIYVMPTVAFTDMNEPLIQKEYRLSEEKIKLINELLSMYLGCKNYHNFTARKKPSDPSNMRYMKSFIMEKPFIRNDVEFVVLKVHGQSFMMHQIRKMVGLVIALVRGKAPMELKQKVFTLEKVSIPRAPGLGLVLDYVHYDRYNERYGKDGMHEILTWDEVEEEVNAFKEKYIYPKIINSEVENETMITWLHERLERHSYDGDAKEEEDNEKEDEAANVSEESSGVVLNNASEANEGDLQKNDDKELNDDSKIKSKQICN